MCNDICKIIADLDAVNYATNSGTRVHEMLRHVVINGADVRGDMAIVNEIIARPDIAAFFGPASRTEVPVAAIINNRFISRRIDRMLIDKHTQRIKILDYKTDIDRTSRRDKYLAQLREYAAILRRIFPNYEIDGYILWTHGWTLEKII